MIRAQRASFVLIFCLWPQFLTHGSSTLVLPGWCMSFVLKSGYSGLLDSFRMGSGHWKDQAMIIIRSLNFRPCHPFSWKGSRDENGVNDRSLTPLFCFCLNTSNNRNSHVGIPEWHSGLAPAFGPGRDPGDPGSNLTSGSRCMEPACPSAYVSAPFSLSVWLSLINKNKKKIRF